MNKLNHDNIEKAFRQHRTGGVLKPICNHRIDGYKCRCFARYVEIEDVQYWKINYLINQHEVHDAQYEYLIRKMYSIATTSISFIQSSGKKVVIYSNWNNRIKIG